MMPLGNPVTACRHTGLMDITTTLSSARAEQLTLLPAATVPARFRLDRATRERGLRHVAEIRRMLADRAAEPLRDRAA